MGEVIVHPNQYRPLYDARAVALIRKTVCKDCSDTQFDEFMYIARMKNLDPLAKQIHCMIINRGKMDREGNSTEQMIPMTGIGGYRSLAKRAGNYLPDDQPARIVRRKTAINPETNPNGLISATVYVKCFAQGEWHRVAGRANWAEYAPLKEEWLFNPESGYDEPTGRKYLPKNNRWFMSPELMLEKCAEAAALRRGWPDDYSGIYSEEEFDKYKVLELSPSEFARMGEQIERQNKLGGPNIIVDWLEDGPLEGVPVGQFKDRVFRFIEANADKPFMIKGFRERNKAALNQFWVHSKGEALELRKKLEGRDTKATSA